MNDQKTLNIINTPMSKVQAAYVTPMQMFFFLTTDNIDEIVINHVLAITMTIIKIHILSTLQLVV